MPESRIPALADTSKKATFAWLTALHRHGMLFCLDDKPEDIFTISDGSRTFSDDEAKEVAGILDMLFAKHGDGLHGLAFEVLSRTFHTQPERRAFTMPSGFTFRMASSFEKNWASQVTSRTRPLA